MDDEKRPVLLPAALVAKIEKKIENSPHSSVAGYVEDVLNEVLKAEEMEIHITEREKMEEIRDRLIKLGYMD